MTVITLVCALAGVACWVFASPVRLAAAAIALFAAHPALTLTVTAAVAACMVAIAAVIVWRGFRDSGWCLVVITRTAGGVAA